MNSVLQTYLNLDIARQRRHEFECHAHVQRRFRNATGVRRPV